MQPSEKTKQLTYMSFKNLCIPNIYLYKCVNVKKNIYIYSIYINISYQVNCVKHLNLSYCCTARVGQVAVIITDGECAQPCDGNNNHMDKDNLSTLHNYEVHTL